MLGNEGESSKRVGGWLARESRVAVVVTGMCHTAMPDLPVALAFGAWGTLFVLLPSYAFILLTCIWFLCFYASTQLFLSPCCPGFSAAVEALWVMTSAAVLPEWVRLVRQYSAICMIVGCCSLC